MRWSLSLGKIAGIGIYIHFTTFILLGWIAFSLGMSSQSWQGAAEGVVLFCCIAAIIVMHELGHALAAKRYGIRTRDITLLPIGGVARLERMPEKPLQELVVALAGPAVNVVLAVGLFAALLLGPGVPGWDTVLRPGAHLLVYLFWVNVMLVLFNMLPAFPMDGGRVLRAVLAMITDYVEATRVAAWIGQAIAVLFAIVGLFGSFIGFANPMLLFIALFVWMGAEAEANMVRTKSILAGVPVERIMASHFLALDPRDTLEHAAELVSGGFQHDFPVVDSGQVVGMLSRKGLLEALTSVPHATTIEGVMRPTSESVHPLDTIETAFERFQKCGGDALPVVEGEHLVGILTVDRIGEYLMLHERMPRERRGVRVPSPRKWNVSEEVER